VQKYQNKLLKSRYHAAKPCCYRPGFVAFIMNNGFESADGQISDPDGYDRSDGNLLLTAFHQYRGGLLLRIAVEEQSGPA